MQVRMNSPATAPPAAEVIEICPYRPAHAAVPPRCVNQPATAVRPIAERRAVKRLHVSTSRAVQVGGPL
jgi:hypothetical protein